MRQRYETEVRYDQPRRETETRKPTTHRNGADHPGACHRLVRVPGGYAYVKDERP